ncbi:S8 family peptidase [Microlunatus speluncae]|uniref:S8 family peptidase n=1 Tax=Microlunatus speluncae TaxID=2594267 RepID=UPI0012661BB2|nr:S8 family serine peptidase [Microlunatus speluncae]
MIGATALGVVIIVVAVTAVVWVVGDQPTAQPDRVEHPVNSELIKQARPDPACTKLPRAKPSGSGDGRLSVIRLRGHCLVPETVLVADADAAAKVDELRKQPDVVAADRAQAAAPPDFKDYEGGDGKQFEEPARDSLGGDRLLGLWPEDGPDVRVAMIDSGVDATHPELAGRVVATRDTVLGTDHSRDHGTFSAGIMAAAADGQGITGISPKVQLLDAQYWRDGGDWGVTEGVNQPGIADEIIWSVDTGARVLSVSATQVEGTSTLTAAYEYAELNGVVAVAAVGNCGGRTSRDEYCRGRDDVMAQADQPTVLGVGATADDTKKADYSSANRTVQLVAPGGNLGEAWWPDHPLRSTCVNDPGRPRTLCTGTGTSFAEPQVAAAAAILVARHPAAAPADIRNALIVSTNRDDLDLEPGQRDDKYGYGRLDILAAVKYLDDHPPKPRPEPPVIRAAARIGGKVELILDSAKLVDVQQVAQGGAPPSFAFSADGAWFAATDGKRLTVVDAYTGRQQSTECACSGVAFNPKNLVLTAQTRGGVKIAQFDPMTADWTGTTYAPKVSGGLDGAKLVGAAGDVALLTLSQGEYANRLIAVWPDSTAITLDDGGLPFEEVVGSAKGRYVVATSPQSCPRVFDLEKSRSTGEPWVWQFWPYDDFFCATTMLAHFEGDTNLQLGWLSGSTTAQKYGCPKPAGDQQLAVTGRLEIRPFQPSREPADLPWKDLDCTASGVWSSDSGDQLRVRVEPPSFEPYKYTIVRKKAGGDGEQKLAEHAEDVVVRPR